MKLAVYAIAKNEGKVIDRWLDAVLPEIRGGDQVVILDTGSEDDTVQRVWLRKAGEAVDITTTTITPWRFDQARNEALALVAEDMDACWSLDIDEVPQPGWRQAIEDAWKPDTTRLRYKFIWNFNADGSPGITFYSDKLHARRGFRWKGIAHEWLVSDDLRDQTQQGHVWTDDLVVHHLQEPRPERMDRDTSLMERAIAELPDDPRLQFYWGRQLMWLNRWEESRLWLDRYLKNPSATWGPERAQAAIYMSYMVWPQFKEKWLFRALAEDANRREPWMEMALYCKAMGDYDAAIVYANRAAKIPVSPVYITDPRFVGDAPRKLAMEAFGEAVKPVRDISNHKEEEHAPEPV